MRRRGFARPAHQLAEALGGAVAQGTTLRDTVAAAPADSLLGYARELAERVASYTIADAADVMSQPGQVKEYLRRRELAQLGGQEETGALLLNTRNRLISDERGIYRGTLDRAVVEPREILRRALIRHAAGIIIYHNHPSGNPSPSREDREFTRRLAAACDTMGVRLLDHIVVGSQDCFSFREGGLL